MIQIKKSIHRIRVYFCGLKIFSCPNPKAAYYQELYARRFSPDLTLDEKTAIISMQFEDGTGYPLRLIKPETFNEKLQWLKLFGDIPPLVTLASDKYRVKEHVADTIGAEHVIPLLGVWDRPEDIDFSALPDAFVLKVNHGSDQNIIVRDKSAADLQSIRQRLADWLRPEANRYYFSFEPSYRDISPKIICEPYVGALAENLTCYKIFTFGGKPELLQVVFDDKTRHMTINYYDLHWNKLPLRQNHPGNDRDIAPPKGLPTMIALAKKLAKPFPHFVRVDFFAVDDTVFFSEFTFFSDNGMAAFHPPDWDKKLGDLIILKHCCPAKAQ